MFAPDDYSKIIQNYLESMLPSWHRCTLILNPAAIISHHPIKPIQLDIIILMCNIDINPIKEPEIIILYYVSEISRSSNSFNLLDIIY